jgi:hypothetical protein
VDHHQVAVLPDQLFLVGLDLHLILGWLDHSLLRRALN